jgi:hypothetical protein
VRSQTCSTCALLIGRAQGGGQNGVAGWCWCSSAWVASTSALVGERWWDRLGWPPWRPSQRARDLVHIGETRDVRRTSGSGQWACAVEVDAGRARRGRSLLKRHAQLGGGTSQCLARGVVLSSARKRDSRWCDCAAEPAGVAD